MATPIWVPNTPITVPVNLRYLDANGDPVTSLYPLSYLILVGQNLNNLITEVDILGSIVSGQTSQITTLTAAIGTIPPAYNTPAIPSQCLTPSGSTILPIDVVLNYLVTDWCNYLAVTGSRSALATSITTQCPGLNAAPSYGTPGTSMSAITGWRATPTTVADTIANLWYTSCDSRAGIARALAAVTPSCSQVIVDYQVVSNTTLTFLLYFDGYSFIPTGYTDAGSLIKITDNDGNIYQVAFNIVNASVDPSPITISASGSTLSPTSTSYRVAVTSNVTNSSLGLSCSKVVISDSTNPGNPIPLGNTCCPDIGNYTGLSVSGTTTLTFCTGLSYTPRFVAYTPKSVYPASFFAFAVESYITYFLGGAFMTFPGPIATSGVTINIDWIAFR